MTREILQQCLVSDESPLVLALRSRLYSWLAGKLVKKPEWKVTHSIFSGNTEISRSIDCLIQTPEGNFAYIIIDKTLRLDDATILERSIRSSQWGLNVVFTKDWLNSYKTSTRRYLLSEMEKHFVSPKKYDLAISHNDLILGSLFYIDVDTDSVKFLRRIRPCGASVYQSNLVECSLDDVLLSPKTGEWVAPGEHESFKVREKRKDQLDKRLAAKKALIEKQRACDFWVDAHGREIRSQELPLRADQLWGKCEICGDYTNDWWLYDPSGEACKCQKCSERNRAK